MPKIKQVLDQELISNRDPRNLARTVPKRSIIREAGKVYTLLIRTMSLHTHNYDNL